MKPQAAIVAPQEQPATHRVEQHPTPARATPQNRSGELPRVRTCIICHAILPANADPRKILCGKRDCTNTRRNHLNHLKRDARPLKGGRNRENYTRCAELASMHGVHPSAIRSWLKKNNHPYIIHDKNIWMLNRIAEQYSQEREARIKNPLPARPKGWKSVKQLASMMGVSTDTARAALRDSSDIRYGSFGMTMYVHPSDAEMLRRRARSEDALPGWEALPDLAVEFGRRLSSLHLVVDRLGLEVRFARREGTRAARHVTAEGARALRAWHANAAKRPFAPRRQRKPHHRSDRSRSERIVAHD